MSKVSTTGLKSRCWPGFAVSGVLGENLFLAPPHAWQRPRSLARGVAAPFLSLAAAPPLCLHLASPPWMRRRICLFSSYKDICGGFQDPPA